MPALYLEAAMLWAQDGMAILKPKREEAAAHLVSPEACCCHSRQLKLALQDLAAGWLPSNLASH